MLGRVKLDNTLVKCDQGNFNQITARSWNQTLVTVVRDTCTTTVREEQHAGKGSITEFKLYAPKCKLRWN